MSSQKSNLLRHLYYINARKNFEAIIKPEIARQYWAHENVSDWKPGSKWQYFSSNEARTLIVVGDVIECSPPKPLS